MNNVQAMIASVPDKVVLTTETGKKYNALSKNEIQRGGEGRILTVDGEKKKVLKVYHPTRGGLTKKKFEQLSKLDPTWFVRPQELLFEAKRIAGFSMEYLSNDYFMLFNIYKKDFCKKNGIDQKKRFKIVKNLTQAISSAHKLDVVIGDLNPYNIMLNKKGDIKIIDVDSFETKEYKHSGILLEDIRDYYYQGKVSKASDYFALSVLIFNMVSFIHPFKGIHKKYKKISDRMIRKIPVFSGDPELKLPKFYEPIKDKSLLDQFKRMYTQKVERFIIDMEGKDSSFIATSPLPKPADIRQYTEKDLIINKVFTGDIMDIIAVNGTLMVTTTTDFHIFDASNKGYITLKRKIDKKLYNQVFLSDNNIVLRNGKKLFIDDKYGSDPKEIKTIGLENGTIIHQIGNTLMLLFEYYVLQLDMTKNFNGLVNTKKDFLDKKHFNYFSGLFYNAASGQFIFKESGHEIDRIKSPVKILEVYQNGCFGMVKFSETTNNNRKKIKQKYFKLDGLNMLLSKRDADDMYRFASSIGKDNEGFIFQSRDGYLRIIRTQDFEEVSKHQCDIATSQSKLNYTQCGILLWENDEIFILNKK